jgi:hypothetical protein
MKFNYSVSKMFVLLLLIILAAVFTKCTSSTTSIENCDGYTGPVTNKNAAALQKVCHFMPKDTIAMWTARYQKNKTNINTKLPDSPVLGDSCSFNNSIVRAIITNTECIGLRVIYGMDEKNKIHVLLVGIKPDYSTLYVRKPADCGVGTIEEKRVKEDKAKKGEPEEELGGGEMSLNP